MGHRQSIDLDFFGNITFSLEELTEELSAIAPVSPLSSSKFMRFLIVGGIKVDIVNYPYEWIDNAVVEEGIVLAGIRDIAAMKLSAITNRGTKKDFIDCYFLLKTFSLNELICFYLKKYSDSQLFTLIKSLTYFEDAEEEPMPKMAESIDWHEVKASIVTAVRGFQQV